MKYKLTQDQERKVGQMARSNFADLLFEILRQREQQLNELFRRSLPESFLETKGRALEIDELLSVFKSKERGE